MQADGFRGELARQGYSVWTTIAHLQLMAHLSQWLAAHDLDAADLDDAAVAWYLRDRRASGQVRRLTSRGLAPLLGYLRHLGLAPARPGQQPGDPVSSLVCEFAGFLATERGLAEGTIRYYCDHARRFLSAHAPHGDVAVLTPGDVRSFLLDENSRRGSRSLQNVVTALRALLRFLHVHGHLPAPLADGALPAIPVWSYLPLTRALRLADVARLLESCDRTTGAGRRDYAVLVLLARLGLRAGEAAALRTGDVSWRAGEILVRGKGGRQERLPLPADVGSALADYCQNSRPLTGQPFLLLQARAPYAGLSADTVTQVVMRTCRRAGLPPAGAHQLRHAAATAMRQAGAPLAEVSQVLRHRHAATTARYGTVEVAELTALTRPWPAGAR
jgi:site-specific recombinase XerD